MDACVYAAGITRLPVLEGEISHIEIPRVATNLGITIVGGADTALVSSTAIFSRRREEKEDCNRHSRLPGAYSRVSGDSVHRNNRWRLYLCFPFTWIYPTLYNVSSQIIGMLREDGNCCTSVTSRRPATRIVVTVLLTPENPKLTVQNAKTTETQSVGRIVELNCGIFNGHNINSGNSVYCFHIIVLYCKFLPNLTVWQVPFFFSWAIWRFESRRKWVTIPKTSKSSLMLLGGFLVTP